MAKIKMTKTELKAQRDALKQFSRFLPTLQLKKQQLQMEIRKSRAMLDENRQAEQLLMDAISVWSALFGESGAEKKTAELLTLQSVDTGTANIAGVTVPVFNSASFEVHEYDLFLESPWLDDAVDVLKELIEVRIKRNILEQQYRLLEAELRSTTQRVNLFEKVKIPECRDNIRRIQIYLGDMDTAGVARAKIAKKKSQEVAA